MKDNIKIPGIRRIYVVSADVLPPDICKQHKAGIIPVVNDLPFAADFFAESEVSCSVEPGGKEKSELKFSTFDAIPFFNIAFVAEDQKGQRFLMGAAEAPVSVKFSGSSGAKTADKVKSEYTVTWNHLPVMVTIWTPDDDNLPLRPQ